MPLERKITGLLLGAMRDDKRFGNCAVEIKVAKGKTLGASQLPDHQRRALMIARTGAMYFKIPDGGYAQSPFDGFILKKSEAYLVVRFCGVRPAETWAIDIAKIPSDEGITLERAREVGIKIRC